MKKLFGCFLCAILLAFGAQAHALSITPGSPIFSSGDETSTSVIKGKVSDLVNSSVELYKQDVGGPESGSLAGSYNTVFSNTLTDPADATISYTGGSIVGPNAYLLVKDGNHSPGWYLFDLTAMLDRKSVV